MVPEPVAIVSLGNKGRESDIAELAVLSEQEIGASGRVQRMRGCRSVE